LVLTTGQKSTEGIVGAARTEGNKRLNRLNHRGHSKVNTQWNLYCMVHNIEELSKTGLGQ
jgi:hypothetical protein